MHQTIVQSKYYKWWAFTSIALCIVLIVIDQIGVSVALPTMAIHFKADLPVVQWVVVGYALTISILILPVGRLSDILGRKHMHIAGFTTFVVGAALAGLSTSLIMLILGRILQGVGTAIILGNSMAIMVTVFP